MNEHAISKRNTDNEQVNKCVVSLVIDYIQIKKER